MLTTANDTQTWLVRTLVPVLAGFLISLGIKAGFHLSSPTVTVFVTGAVVAGYAALARGIEVRYPKVGKWLISLGLAASQPVYVPPEVAAATRAVPGARQVPPFNT
jgi:hypothetical protein